MLANLVVTVFDVATPVQPSFAFISPLLGDLWAIFTLLQNKQNHNLCFTMDAIGFKLMLTILSHFQQCIFLWAFRGLLSQHIITPHRVPTHDVEVTIGEKMTSAGASGWVKLVSAGLLSTCRFTILGSHQTTLVEQSALFEHFQFCKATGMTENSPKRHMWDLEGKDKKEEPHPSPVLQRKEKDGIFLRGNLVFYLLQPRQRCRWEKMGNLKNH